jgi:hypothetical protein
VQNENTQGVIVLGFGPQPMDFLSRAADLCGNGAVLDTDVARMAGATLAAGDSAALAALRSRLEAGALEAQRAATPNVGTSELHWLAHGERGTSSNTMFSVLTGVDACRDHRDHPHDPADFDRCLRLLAAVPRLRLLLPKMAEEGPVWAALVARWDEIERCHLDEVGLGWTKARSAPRTYALMREVIEGARHG